MITSYTFSFKEKDTDDLEITKTVDNRIMISLESGGYTILDANEYYKFIGSLLKIQSDLRKEVENGEG